MKKYEKYDIAEFFGNIDETFVEEANEKLEKRAKRSAKISFLPVAGAALAGAACLTLIIGSGVTSHLGGLLPASHGTSGVTLSPSDSQNENSSFNEIISNQPDHDESRTTRIELDEIVENKLETADVIRYGILDVFKNGNYIIMDDDCRYRLFDSSGNEIPIETPDWNYGLDEITLGGRYYIAPYSTPNGHELFIIDSEDGELNTVPLNVDDNSSLMKIIKTSENSMILHNCQEIEGKRVNNLIFAEIDDNGELKFTSSAAISGNMEFSAYNGTVYGLETRDEAGITSYYINIFDSNFNIAESYELKNFPEECSFIRSLCISENYFLFVDSYYGTKYLLKLDDNDYTVEAELSSEITDYEIVGSFIYYFEHTDNECTLYRLDAKTGKTSSVVFEMPKDKLDRATELNALSDGNLIFWFRSLEKNSTDNVIISAEKLNQIM